MAAQQWFDSERNLAGWYCNTDARAFGPVLDGDETGDAEERLERLEKFVHGCDLEIRRVTDWRAVLDDWQSFECYVRDEYPQHWRDLRGQALRNWIDLWRQDQRRREERIGA